MSGNAHYALNLERGWLEAKNMGRMVAVPEAVLASLVQVAVQSGDLTAMRIAGKSLADFVAGRAEGSLPEKPWDKVLAEARLALGLSGLGALEAERWGRALTLVVRGAPALDDDQLGTAALLGGLFSSLASTDVACVPVDDGRFLCLDPSVAEAVWNWSKAGRSLFSILTEMESVVA